MRTVYVAPCSRCQQPCRFYRMRLCENCLNATNFMRPDLRLVTLKRAVDNRPN